MKNFKKVLALVLAIATILSFATIASAATADFKDAKDVTHTEAVDVLSAIGVLNGYKDGEYKPNRVITRAEAAKIIAMFDNGDTDIKELYAPVNFTDVKAGHWAESFISYCYHTGIIAGVGNNKYAPDADVTGVQFLKMVLVVLGFDAKEEGLVGTGYSVRARNLARAIGLLNGIGNDFDYTKGLTRDNAAQIMLNALQTETVEYGKVIKIGENVAYITDSKATFTGKLLAEEWNLHVENTIDAFGRPGHKWSFHHNDYPNHSHDVVLANYVDTPVATYTTEVDGCTIYDDLGVELIYQSEHLADPGATSYTDGVLGANEKIADSTKVSTGAQGQLTEIYAIACNGGKTVEYRIVHINTYLAQVGPVKDEVKDGRNHVQTPRYVTATVYARTNNENYKGGAAMATLANTGFVTENFAEGDFVLVQGVVTPDKQGVLGIDIKSMTAAKTELTKLTGLDNIKTVPSMYVNGTKTPVACKYAYDADRTVADCWDTFTFIYDSYGNVIGTTKYNAPVNYAVLDKLYVDYAKGDATVYATVVTPAGEKTDVTVNKITAYYPFENEDNGKAVKAADFIATLDDNMAQGLGFQYQWSGSAYYKAFYYCQLINYVVNEDGSYNLTIPGVDNSGNKYLTKNAIIAKGSKFIYDAANPKMPILEVTADTIFLYQNGYAPNATYTSVTGYENVPATLVATQIQYVMKGGKVALVYVLNPQPVNSYKQVYYAGGQPSYDTSTGVGIYTYAVKVLGENGMEDGVITSTKPVFDGKPAGVYKVTLNVSGLATAVELATAADYVVTLHAAPVNNTTYWYGTETNPTILDLSVVAFFNVSGDNTVNKTNLDGKNVSLIFDANGAAVAAYYYG